MYRAFKWECAKGHTNTYITAMSRVLSHQFESIKANLSKGCYCTGCRRRAVPAKFGELFTYRKRKK